LLHPFLTDFGLIDSFIVIFFKVLAAGTYLSKQAHHILFYIVLMKCLTVFRCMTISMSCCCRKGTFGTRVPVTVRRVSDSQQLTRRHNSHLGFPARSGDGRRRRRPAFSAHVHLRCQVIGTLVIAWHRSTCDHIGRIALPSAGVYVAWSPLCDLYRCCDQYCSVVA